MQARHLYFTIYLLVITYFDPRLCVVNELKLAALATNQGEEEVIRVRLSICLLYVGFICKMKVKICY